MVPRYLLDTNICIYIRSRRPLQVLTHFERLEPDEAAISVVTYGELVFGVEKSGRPVAAAAAHERIMQSLPILPLTRQAGDIYGLLRASLASAGQIIGGNDLWIAAHALAENLILVTNNEREFRRVKGLKVENWTR